MAAPLRRSPSAPRHSRDAEFELLDTTDPTPAARTPRLRVAGTPELVVDDGHPDFHDLPRYRKR